MLHFVKKYIASRRLKRLFAEAQHIRLTDKEKEGLYAALKETTAEIPAEQQGNRRHTRNAFIPSFKPALAAFALALILMISGSVSLAAERALPGDMLYPIKVDVNEEVREKLLFSQEAQALFELQRIERRLEEAEMLAFQRTFTKEAGGELQHKLASHAEALRAYHERFTAQGNEAAAATIGLELEASLATHARILSLLAVPPSSQETTALGGPETDEVSKEALETFTTHLQTTHSFAAALRAEIEKELAPKKTPQIKEAAENRRAAAAKKITEVETFIAETKTHIDATTAAHAETRLAKAQELLRNGVSYLETAAYGDAFLAFQHAHRVAQEAKLTVKTAQAFHITFPPGEGPSENAANQEEQQSLSNEPAHQIEETEEQTTQQTNPHPLPLEKPREIIEETVPQLMLFEQEGN